MSRRVRLRHLPGRLTTGVFIVNSGLSKRHADDDTAAALHGMAAAAYPFLHSIPPQRFVRLVCAGELVLGTALLLPVVPTVVAGTALMAFSAGLLGLYLRTPEMREERSLRPTQQGMSIAKDVWMFGIGLTLLIDGLGAEQDVARAQQVLTDAGGSDVQRRDMYRGSAIGPISPVAEEMWVSTRPGDEVGTVEYVKLGDPEGIITLGEETDNGEPRVAGERSPTRKC